MILSSPFRDVNFKMNQNDWILNRKSMKNVDDFDMPTYFSLFPLSQSNRKMRHTTVTDQIENKMYWNRIHGSSEW